MSRAQSRGGKRSGASAAIRSTYADSSSSSSEQLHQRTLRSGAVIQLPHAAQRVKASPTSEQLQRRQHAAQQRAAQREEAANKRRAAQKAAATSQRMRLETAAVEATAAEAAAAAAAASESAHWEPIDPAHGNRHLLLLTEQKHADELAEVKQHYASTGGIGRILSVHRIQNPQLLQRYEQARQQLQRAGSSTKGDIIAYHGTRVNDPALIYDSATGFDISQGVYAPGYLWSAANAGYSSSGFKFQVARAHLPFGRGVHNPLTGISIGVGQILRLKLIQTAADQKISAQFGYYLISRSEHMLPTHLISFV